MNDHVCSSQRHSYTCRSVFSVFLLIGTNCENFVAQVLTSFFKHDFSQVVPSIQSLFLPLCSSCLSLLFLLIFLLFLSTSLSQFLSSSVLDVSCRYFCDCYFFALIVFLFWYIFCSLVAILLLFMFLFLPPVQNLVCFLFEEESAY